MNGMQDSFLQVFGQVAGIGGLALGVLLVLYREVLRRRIFPQLTRDHGYRIIRLIIVLTWTVAVLGLAAWVYTSRLGADVAKNAEPPFGPAIPFKTGWVFIGYYDGGKQTFVEGPTSVVAFRPTGGERGQIVPAVGDILRIRKDRNVIIAAYKTAGLKNQLTSPPLVKDPMTDEDETGVQLKEGTFVIVRDVEASGYAGRAASIWARVASCDDQTDSCRRARDETR
jgi:hypothetical protein